MIKFEIPNQRTIFAEYLVLDYNGTLAIDGELISGIKDKLNALTDRINIHVVTGDTYGKAKENLKEVRCECVVIQEKNQQEFKREYVSKLGADKVIAIGNGLNDALMLHKSALGIVVLQKEGVSAKTLFNADIVFATVTDAIDSINNPLRIAATLRS
jgi:P-type E1-E2 ATPase